MHPAPSVAPDTNLSRRIDDVQEQLVALREQVKRLEQHVTQLDELRDAVASLKEELEDRTEIG